MAVQVREMALVLPYNVMAESEYHTLSLHHALPVVATPVLLVLISAGHSRILLAGQVMVGGVVSWTVMVWTQLARLPHWSIAAQVREMTLVFPQLVVTASV